MGHNEVAHILEDAHKVKENHSSDFSDVYRDLVDLKKHEGSAQYQTDLKELNQKLHADGILPNVEIVGVDAEHPSKILLQDKNKSVFEKDASSLDNNVGALNSSGLDLHDPRQMRDQLLAHAVGADIHGNPDGSFDVKSPILDMLDDPSKATEGILDTVRKGLLEPDSGGGSDTSALQSLGMNRWEAEAWKGDGGDERERERERSDESEE